MSDTLSEFLGALGLSEEPYGIFYTDIEPTEGFVPAVNQPLSWSWSARARSTPVLHKQHGKG